MSFPVITIGDMVRLQKMLIDSLGIPRLLAVSGGSMGGMQALRMGGRVSRTRWSRRSRSPPRRGTARSRSRSTKWGGRPSWPIPIGTSGNYYGKQPPARGLAVARMVGHITYMSDDSMREKFGRRLRGKEKFGFGFDVDFEVESYLRYRGSQFVNRFDANSYLYITKAMDYFDLTNGNGSLAAALETAQRPLPGDQLQLGLAVSELPVAGDGARAAVAQSRRGVRANCSRTTATIRSWWTWRSRATLVRGFLASTFEKAGNERSRAGFVRELLGRSDYAIIGEIVEPKSQGARPGLRRRRTAGVAGRE